MSDISSSDSLQEAARLLIEIAPSARSKGERRLLVWRRLRKVFTFNRISEIDRQSPRVVVTADEMDALRAAAKAGEAGVYQRMLDRIERLEGLLDEVRDFRSRMEAALPQLENRSVGGESQRRDRRHQAQHDPSG